MFHMVSEFSTFQSVEAILLAVAGIVEIITPRVLNIAKFNSMKDVGVHFG